ncbi:uncharacterized protein LOC134672833 [Cydia fagiglandana]|uniref:uncharacterized protein LOC134672833 n=1 Tax=Cydia fagiglandana TaxID=1458189 RepID=UPI002FEE1B9C
MGEGTDLSDGENPDQTPENSNLVEQNSSTSPRDDSMEGGQNMNSSTKRGREDSEEEPWCIVGRDGKRRREGTNSPVKNKEEEIKYEAYISAAEALPKQFAFARMMQQNNIADIIEIKYINPNKIYVHFGSESALEKLITCQAIKEKAWSIVRTSEVAASYGVIRQVELDLTEKEILESIDGGAQLLSVKRLTRRSEDGKWINSECVRLGFRGSSLPAYVHVFGMRLMVKPYIFPVTQCSNCWKFGHVKRLCPKTKIVCPKCSKNHNNCEVTKYVCVNCTGDHLALSKMCPVYLKERKIRSIMADFNVTYRKALSMYVPESPVREIKDTPEIELNKSDASFPKIRFNSENEEQSQDTLPTQIPKSYVAVAKPTSSSAKEKASPKKNGTGKKKHKKTNPQKNKHITYDTQTDESEGSCMDVDIESSSDTNNSLDMKKGKKKVNEERRKSNKEKKSDNITLEKVMEMLKNIFCSENKPVVDKIVSVVKNGIRWLVSYVTKHFFDLPPLSQFLGCDGQ